MSYALKIQADAETVERIRAESRQARSLLDETFPSERCAQIRVPQVQWAIRRAGVDPMPEIVVATVKP